MKEKLLKYQKIINDKQYIVNILNWDLKVSTPKDSIKSQTEVIASLEEDIFKLETSDEYKKLLEDFINSKDYLTLEESEAKCIKKVLKKVLEKRKIPSNFNKEYLKTVQESTIAWEKAKLKDDYKLFEPYLTKTIEMTKKYYRYIDSEKNLYDIMLDQYESKLDRKFIDKLFSKLKKELIPLIKEISVEEDKKLIRDLSEDKLKKCSEILLDYIGFDMNKGTLGIYPHGFTEKMNQNDVRIAFEKTNDLPYFVSTIIHEGGHGIFEQNISNKLSKYYNTTSSNIFALHESQSRFYENILGRNVNFWIPIYDKIKETLNLDISVEEFCSYLTQVRPNPIRTKSDEVTYCMHIILRYEIERDLFDGKITVKDLPNVWNKKMKEYLSLETFNNKNGLMQDVHWSCGNFGYFPSYLIGTICDGMLLELVEKEVGKVDKLLKDGKIKQITNFFINNIYKYGGAYSALETIEKLCNKDISVEPIIKYFKSKYSKK